MPKYYNMLNLARFLKPYGDKNLKIEGYW